MGCDHDCGHCSSNCEHREIPIEKTNDFSKVKKVIAVMSGKGGVGKSSVCAMLSVLMNRRGYSTAILDADITGPSIPKLFGVNGRIQGDECGMYPARTKTGIEVMSTNLLLANDTDPVIFRGAMIAGMVKQFWTETVWNDVDYMFVDMPPGTGDVPLTVFQSLPVDGIVVVTSPQDLVSMIVAKAVHMAEKMDLPIVGLIENYSYLLCPDCGKKIEPFGHGNTDAAADEYGLPVLAKLPIDPEFAHQCDAGLVELFESTALDAAADALEKL